MGAAHQAWAQADNAMHGNIGGQKGLLSLSFWQTISACMAWSPLHVACAICLQAMSPKK